MFVLVMNLTLLNQYLFSKDVNTLQEGNQFKILKYIPVLLSFEG